MKTLPLVACFHLKVGYYHSIFEPISAYMHFGLLCIAFSRWTKIHYHNPAEKNCISGNICAVLWCSRILDTGRMASASASNCLFCNSLWNSNICNCINFKTSLEYFVLFSSDLSTQLGTTRKFPSMCRFQKNWIWRPSCLLHAIITTVTINKLCRRRPTPCLLKISKLFNMGTFRSGVQIQSPMLDILVAPW